VIEACLKEAFKSMKKFTSALFAVLALVVLFGW